MVAHNGEANTLHHKAELTMHLGNCLHSVVWAHHHKGIFGFPDNNPLSPHILRAPRSSDSKEAAKVVHLPDPVLDSFSFRIPGIALPATLQEMADVQQLLGIALP